MNAIDTILKELATAKKTLLPKITGLQDFTKIGILPETRQQVEVALTSYNNRLNDINESVKWLRRLKADGYPILPVLVVSDAVLSDLTSNIGTLNDVFTDFASADQAITATITAGTPTEQAAA